MSFGNSHFKMIARLLIVFFVLSGCFSIENCNYFKVDSRNITRCTICSPGYQLNLNYTQCSICNRYDPYCLRCDANSNNTALECQACITGYKIKAGKCINIDGCLDPNCNQCSSNASQCFSCNQGFFLSISKKCEQCSVRNQFDQGNETCACDHGYYLSVTNGSICEKCSYPCQTCEREKYFCTLCIYGYYMSNSKQGNCSLCLTPNCILCKDQDRCLNCTIGYLLVNGSCQIQLQQQNINNYINIPEFYYFCLPGCFYCYKYDFCVTCLEGYSRNLYNTACQACPIGCKRCESLKQLQCFSCYPGFRLVQTICVKCKDQNCLNCNTTQSVCSKCAIGFTSIDGKCLPCTKNCNKCDHLGNGTCDEGQCFSGYARVTNTTCALCALGCYSCNTVDISTCISCPIGSFQIAGGQCEICPSSCVTCQSAKICIFCRQGFRLVNSQCFADCLYPCLECSPFNSNICSSCFDGYYLSEDMTCKPDVSCNTYQNCTICPVSYYLDLYSFRCLQCQLQQHCLKCQTESTKCAICSDGYYLIQNSCRSCSSSCLTCQLETYCFSCQPRYYLYKEDDSQVYGDCKPCSTNCLTCIDEFDKCNSCNETQELIGFDCVSSQNIIFLITMQDSSQSSSNAEEFAFIKQILAFTKALADAFGPPYSTNPSLLYLKDISAGSIKVSYMATINNMDPRVLLPKIITALNSFTTFKSFTIINTQIVTNGFQSDIIMEPPTSYFVVALLPTPFFVFSLIFVGYSFYKRRLAKEQENEENKEAEARIQPMQTGKNLKTDENGATTL